MLRSIDPIMTDPKKVTAGILLIGDELLSGRTQDTNLAVIAKFLEPLGVQVGEARVLSDKADIISGAVKEFSDRFDYVFTTGGIGPTHDDITAACVAKAFDQELIQNPEALRRLQEHYQTSGLELTAARLRMANTPAQATLIDNPISTAPGFQVENVFVMAGVPKIMQAMFDGIKHQLQGGAPVLSRTVVCNLGEGTVAAGLEAIQNRYSQTDIGSYPRFGHGDFWVSVVARHTDASLLAQIVTELCELIENLNGEYQLDPGEVIS